MIGVLKTFVFANGLYEWFGSEMGNAPVPAYDKAQTTSIILDGEHLELFLFCRPVDSTTYLEFLSKE